MADTPKSTHVANGPLWVIALALVTIAGCLVLLVLKKSSTPTDPAPAAEIVEAVEDPAPPEPAPVVPVRPKTRLAQVVARKPVASLPAPTPPDVPIINDQPVVTPVAETPPVPMVSGGLAPLTGRFDNASGLGATISGQVVLKGTPPPEIQNNAISADPNCSRFHSQPVKTQFYVVSTNGGLANVFVFIRSGLEGKQFTPPTTPVLINQVGCEYEPYISAAMVRQTIRVGNSDPVLHNVHPTPTARGNRESNRAQMPGASPLNFSFNVAELPIRIKCDVHPWMFAYVFVVDHPFFAITDENGNFSIKNVPTGKYVLEAYHLKTHRDKSAGVTQSITVNDNQTIEANFVVDLTNRR